MPDPEQSPISQTDVHMDLSSLGCHNRAADEDDANTDMGTHMHRSTLTSLVVITETQISLTLSMMQTNTTDLSAAAHLTAPTQRGEAKLIIKHAVVTLVAPHSTGTCGNLSI